MARNPDDSRSLRAEVDELKAAIRRLTSRSPFTGTGMKTSAGGGVQSQDFDGDLAAGSAGTKGWAMNAARAAFGEILLRPGSIGNDSLTSPVDGKSGNVSRTGFALATGALAELTGQNIVVPAGFTRAIGSMGATVFSYNPNTTGGSNGAGGDAIYCQAAFGGTSANANPVGVSGSGGYATSFSAAGFDISGLTAGATLRLSVYGASAYQALAANVNNYANAYCSITWLR